MSYISTRISVSDALSLLIERGVADPAEQLLEALKDGELSAKGLVDGARRAIADAWWHHINSPLDETNVVWFYDKQTLPPTPFRAEMIDIPRAEVERLWPKHDVPVVAPNTPAAPPARRRGPKPEKLAATVAVMMDDIRTESLSRDALNGMKEEALAAKYAVSRDTARRARDQVLGTIAANGTNPDK